MPRLDGIANGLVGSKGSEKLGVCHGRQDTCDADIRQREYVPMDRLPENGMMRRTDWPREQKMTDMEQALTSFANTQLDHMAEMANEIARLRALNAELVAALDDMRRDALNLACGKRIRNFDELVCRTDLLLARARKEPA